MACPTRPTPSQRPAARAAACANVPSLGSAPLGSAPSAAPPRQRHGLAPAWLARARPAWQRPLGSALFKATTRLLRLLRARLTVPGSAALQGSGRPTGRPATASGARASRLQSRAHFPAFDHPGRERWSRPSASSAAPSTARPRRRSRRSWRRARRPRGCRSRRARRCREVRGEARLRSGAGRPENCRCLVVAYNLKGGCLPPLSNLGELVAAEADRPSSRLPLS